MKISERGQITIPKRFRDQYGFAEDVEVEIIPQERGILIAKRSTKQHPVQLLFGILDKKSSTDTFIEEIRGR
ncbi:MAG: AbrB/MazE/SpoVT family DNA-binding domain-containing protein [Vulcanimicrobiota bacterium]